MLSWLATTYQISPLGLRSVQNLRQKSGTCQIIQDGGWRMIVFPFLFNDSVLIPRILGKLDGLRELFYWQHNNY